MKRAVSGLAARRAVRGPRRRLAVCEPGRSPAVRAAAFVVAVCTAFAGPARAGSEFSLGGLGEWVWPSDVRGSGMGRVGIAVPEKRNLSLVNPAAAAFIEQPTLHLSMAREARTADDGESTFRDRSVDFPLLRGVVLAPRGIRLSVALHQWNHTEFDLVGSGPPDTLFGSVTRIEGTGGFTALSVGAAARPASWLAVGVEADFPFGSYRETWRREYPDSLFLDSVDRIKGTPGSAPSWTIGAVAVFGRAAAGGFVRPARDLAVGEELTIVSGHVTSAERTFRLPLEAGAGMSVEMRRGLRAGFDATFSEWSTFTVDGETPRGFRDATRIGAGLEWVRNPSPRARFLQRVPLRLGYHRQPWHFRDAEGKGIDERFVSFGLGIPFSQDNGMVDAALEIGRRGDLGGNGLEESIVRVAIAVTYSRVDTRLFPR